MNPSPRSIVYLTAGAGGMYCGSCMHDNTLARALLRQGVDVQLIPTYTPIRTDEQDVSIDRVFFGGVNVFLEEKLPLYRLLTPWVGRLFDQRWLLRWATSRTTSASPRLLGALTVSMLRGTAGHQRAEVRRLCAWLERSPPTDLIVFSNMLIAGCVPELKRRLNVPVLVTLQGDDIFLEALPASYREQALREIQRLVPSIDGFLVHSRFYAERMGQMMQIPSERFLRVPLGIDLDGFDAFAPPAPRPPTLGYLARLAPEKGLHRLVDAFLALRQRPALREARLRIAGWLGEHQREYCEQQFRRLREAGAADHFAYVGAVSRQEKLAFLREIDVLSVPTEYHEPKGLYVLEALAAGVPVVQPAHGAFPELLAETGGGILVPPEDPAALADQLAALLLDPEMRGRLGRQGQQAVRERYHAGAMARATWQTLQSVLPQPPARASAAEQPSSGPSGVHQ